MHAQVQAARWLTLLLMPLLYMQHTQRAKLTTTDRLLQAAYAQRRELKRSFQRWSEHAEECRFAKAAQNRKEELWRKVHGWLGEL